MKYCQIHKNLAIFLVIFIAACSFISFKAYADDSVSEISVTYCSDCVPHQFTNEKGEPDGPILDYWKLWSDKTGIGVNFIPAKWGETLSNVREGKADAHAGLFFNEDRAKYLNYGVSLLSSDTHLFFHKDIPFQNSFDELKAYRIGVLSGDFVEDWLKNKLGKDSVVSFKDYPSLVTGLKTGAVKVFASDTQPALYQLAGAGLLTMFHYEKLKPLYSNKFHTAVNKNKQSLLDVVNRGMLSITPEEKLRISRTWASGMRIDDPDAIIIAIDSDYPPYSSIGINGEPQGLFIDLWKEWGLAVNKTVHFMPSSWAQTLEAVRTGEADIHSGLFQSADREKWFAFSRPIHTIKTGLYTLRDTENADKNLSALKGMPVAAVAGSFQADYLRDKQPDIDIFEVTNRAEYYLALMKGDVAAVVEETTPMESLAAKFGLSGAIVRNEELFNKEVHAGVQKENTNLLKLVEEGFEKIPTSRLAEIEENWISNPNDRFFGDSGSNTSLTKEEKEWIAAHPKITLAATPNWPPFEWKDQETEEYRGISAAMIKLAAEKVGLEIEPVFGSWKSLIEKLKNKELDVAPGLNKTPDREEFLLFTEPFVEYFSVIYTGQGEKDIKALSDLSGKTVSVEEGYALAEILKRDHPEIKLKRVASTLEALQLLSTGDVDAYIGNQLVGNYLIKKFLLENIKVVGFYNKIPGMFRFGIRKDLPILQSILSKGLSSISKKERARVIKDYTGVDIRAGKHISLTDKEREWISKHRNIKLGVDQSWPPFEFINEKGEYSGLAAGFVDVLSERLNIEMTPNPDMSWGDAINSIKNGEGIIDVLPAAAVTPERRKYLNFTKPYLTFPLVISTRKDAVYVNGLEDLSGKKVGVVEGYYTHEILKNDHPDIELVFTPTVSDGLQMLSKGEIYAFFDNLAVISYESERLGLEDIKVAAPTDHKVELSMAVRKDWPELVSLLNKALDTVDEKERSIIKNTWLAVQINIGTDIKTILMWAAPVTLVAILVITIITVWNRKLGGEIAQRKQAQSELALTLESLDEKNNMLEGLSAKLAKYLSPQIYNSIFSGAQDVTLSTERKKLTVFFSDIKDFTQTTEDMQPEDLTFVLNNYFTEMSAIALEYGATIDKFIGDAMLMFFGDPETQGTKKDAELCVRMAIAMQKRMKELEREWNAQGYSKPFKMRIGINTGYCNVGNFGSDNRMDYTIIGGEVNLAARLEGNADIGGILISSETYSLVQDVIVAEERPAISAKGIRKEVIPYSVISLRGEEPELTEEKTIKINEAGFSLILDIDAVSESKKAEISAYLRDVAKRLKSD